MKLTHITKFLAVPVVLLYLACSSAPPEHTARTIQLLREMRTQATTGVDFDKLTDKLVEAKLEYQKSKDESSSKEVKLLLGMSIESFDNSLRGFRLGDTSQAAFDVWEIGVRDCEDAAKQLGI